MIAEREAGDSYPTIAKRHGMSKGWVRQHLIENNCFITNRLSDDLKAQIVGRYKVLQSTRAVADEFDIKLCTVRYVIKSAGLQPGPASKSEVSDETIQQMIAERVAGDTYAVIAERHGVCRDWARQLIVRNGCDIRFRKQLSGGQKDEIAERYKKLRSIHKVAAEFGVEPSTVSYVVKDAGFQLGTSRKWQVNERIFERPNTVMAYWLGFLMADGSLRKVGNTWSLNFSLQHSDAAHLYEYAKTIGLSHQAVHNYSRLTSVTFCHPKLGQWLKQWGIVPRKTYVFIPPKAPFELLPHYLRGWFDGDGCISLHSGDGLYSATLTGHEKAALEWYGRALKQIGYNGEWRLYLQKTRLGSAWNARIMRKSDLFSLCHALKVRGSLKLVRKWQPLIEYEQSDAKRSAAEQKLDARIAREYSQGKTLRELRDRYDVGEKRIRRALRYYHVSTRPRGTQPSARVFNSRAARSRGNPDTPASG